MAHDPFRHQWAERAADYFVATFGLPPITARLLAWLMICRPAEQSGAQLAQALGVSRASITSSLRQGQATGLITRRTRRGDRTVYYVIDDNAWNDVIRRRITAMSTFVGIAEDAIEHIEDDGESAARIRAARDVFAWLRTFADAPQLVSDPKESHR